MSGEEKILLQIKQMDDGIAMQCCCNDVIELGSIAYSIARLCKETPVLAVMIIEAMDKVAHDSEDSVVEMPDFDQLLKNIK